MLWRCFGVVWSLSCLSCAIVVGTCAWYCAWPHHAWLVGGCCSVLWGVGRECSVGGKPVAACALSGWLPTFPWPMAIYLHATKASPSLHPSFPPSFSTQVGGVYVLIYPFLLLLPSSSTFAEHLFSSFTPLCVRERECVAEVVRARSSTDLSPVPMRRWRVPFVFPEVRWAPTSISRPRGAS